MLRLSLPITVYCCAMAVLLGACMGSFLNCLTWRMLHGESVLRGRSHCDACGHVLGARDLVPVLSYVCSGGKCRYCGAKLSARHVWGELAGGAMFVSALLKYDISLQVLEAWLLACVLLACAFADLEGYIITRPIFTVRRRGVIVFLVWEPEPLHRLIQGALGGLAVPGALLAVVLMMEKRMGREAMGGGDLKLLALTGLYPRLDGKSSMPAAGLCAGHLRGAGLRRRDAPIPWGPSIAAAAWVTLLTGDRVLQWYLSLFGM